MGKIATFFVLVQLYCNCTCTYIVICAHFANILDIDTLSEIKYYKIKIKKIKHIQNFSELKCYSPECLGVFLLTVGLGVLECVGYSA